MIHRIAVLGAGYAGTSAAGHLARHLHPDDVEITVVNAEADFVERIRLHQLAAGRPLPRHPLAAMFAGTGIKLRVARVESLDPGRRVVGLSDGHLEYDTLLYTLGSTAAVRGGDAHHVADRPAAERLRARLDELPPGSSVLVVGGNLTGIEVATDLAEHRPGLRITLATAGEAGGRLSPRSRGHLMRAFDRLGVTVREHTTVDPAGPTGADVTVWATGFAVPPIAAASGLAVQSDGRITVDRRMRSVSHPGVYAAGDSVHVIGDNGLPLPMSCGSAGFTRMQATAAILGDLTGRKVAEKPLPYVGNCIGLGSADAIFQPVDEHARSRDRSLRGRAAAGVKAFVYRGTVWNMRHPTYGLPARRHRLTALSDRSAAAVDG